MEVLLTFTGMKSEQRFNRIHGLILLVVTDEHDLCDVFENMGETLVGSKPFCVFKLEGHDTRLLRISLSARISAQIPDSLPCSKTKSQISG